MSFPVAISSYAFNSLIQSNHMNLFGYLELVYSRYGVRQADISTALLPPENLESSAIWSIHDFLSEREMTLANMNLDGLQIWSDQEDKRQADHQLIWQYLQAARRLGAKCIRLDLGSHEESDVMRDEAFGTIVERLREFCEYCHEYGMKIGPANGSGFARLPANLQNIFTTIDHPAYGHSLVVGNWPAGKGREMIDVCLSALMHVCFPAETVIWAKDLIRRIARTDYHGAYSIRQDCGTHELIRADWQISVLRGLIAELKAEGLETITSPGYFCQIAKIDPPDGILEI